ncbi:Holliday junction branch migration DNA helicase RuvB [bacterium]|jgi:holliday junction DNA helicase RuvB|nr:Holliday junction branch migration DNA helicase RuvB [bacterium]MBT7772485.1 Holliday junction branch migration DNA helicase RuvB [bacterium]
MAIEDFSDTGSGKTTTSVVSADTGGDEKFENKLRPTDFENYIGQQEVKSNMKVFVAAAKKRGDPLDHALFYGPPGLGKTTLANILAVEMGANLRVTSGPALEKPGDLAAILTNLKPNDFLFIDEIHRLRLPVEEILYTAMEDFAIDLIVGKGPSARTMRIDVPRFTLLGATTRASLLSGPLRDRFGHVEKLRFYEADEIQQIIERSAKILDVKIDPNAAEVLARSARRTPRIANRLLRRVRDFAEIDHAGIITKIVADQSLKNLSIDAIGLDHADQEYLQTLCQKFSGGPAGLSTLAAAIGEDEQTIEDMIEPFLIREGLLQKTPRGRVATEHGWNHLGLNFPAKNSKLF